MEYVYIIHQHNLIFHISSSTIELLFAVIIKYLYICNCNYVSTRVIYGEKTKLYDNLKKQVGLTRGQSDHWITIYL